MQVLHERGLGTDGETPKLLTDERVRQADVVVTMGCGQTCPVYPGTTYEDWTLEDPGGTTSRPYAGSSARSTPGYGISSSG